MIHNRNTRTLGIRRNDRSCCNFMKRLSMRRRSLDFTVAALLIICVLSITTTCHGYGLLSMHKRRPFQLSPRLHHFAVEKISLYPSTKIEVNRHRQQLPLSKFKLSNGSVRIGSRLFSKRSNVEIGIQTAQLLLNPKKHAMLKRDLIKTYPLVPAPFIDSCIKITAKAFSSVAPETLQEALQPGGMDKYRPVIRTALIDTIMAQRQVQMLPILSTSDKNNMISMMVDQALTQTFKDSEYLLQQPQVRATQLLNAIHDIEYTELTRLQRFMFRYRRNRPAYIGIASALSLMLYAECFCAGSYIRAVKQIAAGVLLSGKYLWYGIRYGIKYIATYAETFLSFLAAKLSRLVST